MCLILDANCYSDYCNGHKDMLPVKAWIESQKNRLAFSYTKRMERELESCTEMMSILQGYDQAGRIKEIDPEIVGHERDRLKRDCRKEIKSGEKDMDILALANVSNTKILVTKDNNLIQDFKNSKIVRQGRVYQRKEHRSLLVKHVCKG